MTTTAGEGRGDLKSSLLASEGLIGVNGDRWRLSEMRMLMKSDVVAAGERERVKEVVAGRIELEMGRKGSSLFYSGIVLSWS